jgi:hypothetical protein
MIKWFSVIPSRNAAQQQNLFVITAASLRSRKQSILFIMQAPLFRHCEPLAARQSNNKTTKKIVMKKINNCFYS